MAKATLDQVRSWLEAHNAGLSPLNHQRLSELAQRIQPHVEVVDGALSVDAHQALACKAPSGATLPTRVTLGGISLAVALRELIDRGVVRGISLADGAATGTTLEAI